MAKRKVRFDEVVDQKSFERWLTSLPKEQSIPISVILAHRIAMRVLPLAAMPQDFGEPHFASALVKVLRCGAITQVACTYSTKEIRAAADSAYLNAVHRAPLNTRAAWAAADTAAFETSSTNSDVAKKAAQTAAFASFASDRAPDIWNCLGRDLRLLEEGISVANLLEIPLWTERYEWWNYAWNTMQRIPTVPENTLDRWDIWLEWYRNVSFGFPAFANCGDNLKALERRIALGDGRKDFWDREPGDINREIALWIDEARRLAAVVPTTEGDFESRPASIETMVRGGLVVLARDEPLADLAAATADAAVVDLAHGLRHLSSEAALAQADRRIVEFLSEAAKAVEKAAHDQSKLFESGRNQKALSNYSATVDTEWSPILVAQYHGLVVQFAQVLNHFEAWRKFIAKPIVAAVPIAPAELATHVEAIASSLEEVKAAFKPDVLFKLKSLAQSFRQAINRWQIDDPSHPINAQVLEAMQSDIAVSVSNVLLSLARTGFEHHAGYLIAGTVGAAGIFARNLIVGTILDRLQRSYPSVYTIIVSSFKALKKFEKDTKAD